MKVLRCGAVSGRVSSHAACRSTRRRPRAPTSDRGAAGAGSNPLGRGCPPRVREFVPGPPGPSVLAPDDLLLLPAAGVFAELVDEPPAVHPLQNIPLVIVPARTRGSEAPAPPASPSGLAVPRVTRPSGLRPQQPAPDPLPGASVFLPELCPGPCVLCPSSCAQRCDLGLATKPQALSTAWRCRGGLGAQGPGPRSRRSRRLPVPTCPPAPGPRGPHRMALLSFS